MKVNFLSRHEKVKRRVADKVNYQNPYHIGKRQIWSEWLSLITIQTWPSLGKQISWSNWNLPKTTHSFPETALHTPFSFALMSGDQSNFLTTIQLLKCIFISGIIRLLNEVNFHVYIDSRFNNVLSDFRYCKSASLGLNNFEKENRAFTNKKKKINEKSIIPMCWYVRRLILHCSKSLEDLCLSLLSHGYMTWLAVLCSYFKGTW